MRAPGFVVAVALVPSTAMAQPVASEAISDGAPHTAVEPKREYRHPPAGLGGSLAFGWASQHGSEGWLARFEYEVLPVMAPDGQIGGVFGFIPGIEYWRRSHDGGVDQGFSLPVVIAGGIRIFPGRVLIGFGVDALNIDSIATDAGFGMYAPLLMANASIDILGIRIGADARMVRRWQIGADDFTQYQLVISAGYTQSTVRSKKPYY